MKFSIPRLHSGGLIVNYACSSKCGHCHYNSSPQRSKDYITPETAGKIFKFLKNNGCHSIHIGGGEPFLQIEKLKTILQVAMEENINIEYIETNSSWYKNDPQAIQILKDLKELNITMLLLSISPLHNEYIPFQKVEGVIKACQQENISIFPWIRDFAPDICRLDKSKPHSLTEYEALFGPNYKQSIINRYGITIGGRAIETFRDEYTEYSPEDVLKENPPCSSYFTNTSHFHVDLYGKYIPCHCVGLQFDIDDVTRETIDDEKYPLANALFHNGIQGAFDFAVNKGFKKGRYISACELCEDIRHFLFLNYKHNEVGPDGFYNEIKQRGK